MRILFVCTGNTCRSPMAEHIARHQLAERGLSWQVASAGLHAAPGMPMSAPAVNALVRRHVVLNAHSSRPVDEEMLASADIVLTMTAAHRSEVVRRFPHMAHKVHVLGAFAAGAAPDEPLRDIRQYDLADPFGFSDDRYELCAKALEGSIEQMLGRLSAQEADVPEQSVSDAGNEPPRPGEHGEDDGLEMEGHNDGG
ncbi:MAG: low molecular weight protein arginine phosphatase [Alicyclobacillaceae bacterium]|nr:low molecular weight protein arginine phosphatase [Alicyclobacillaceae bacterium]